MLPCTHARGREALVLDNLNGWELFALLLLALLIFGEKLPKVIADGMRMLRNLRQMATNATGDLSRELGTDIRIEDLNPKAFMRKHLLSEEDEADLRKPLQSFYQEMKQEGDGLKGAVDLKSHDAVSAAPPSAVAPPAPVRQNYDDAT
jgi:sec-independent protein translocase protein TatB